MCRETGVSSFQFVARFMPASELRVYISSTFVDLQPEREHLIRKIFPEIRALCRQRGVTFTEIDLRWGLAGEEELGGGNFRTCLEEIDLCRPYFIGITGAEYGRVMRLNEIYDDPELLEKFPWVEEAAADELSLTEIEFRYGVLGLEARQAILGRRAVGGGGRVEQAVSVEPARPDSRDHSWFYFRRVRHSHDESSPGERERLESLKDEIRQAGLRVREFRDPESLGELVYDDLLEIIRRDFAGLEAPTPLELERRAHAAFADSRCHFYIPNPAYLKRLDDHAAGSGAPLILYAESGSGKSALAAYWARRFRERHPAAFVIEHYIGNGASPVDHTSLIRHVVAEIRERYQIDEEIPAEDRDLEECFPEWLAKVNAEPLVLIIDGVNLLYGPALNLDWLPVTLPSHVRLVVTSTVEHTLVVMRERGWEQMGMQPMSAELRQAVVACYLQEFHRELPIAQINRITTDPKISSPLFLRTLLEQVRLLGEHRHLSRRTGYYLEATGTEDLFQRVLEHAEEDFGAGRLRRIMTTLWGARAGFSEPELSEITGFSRLTVASIVVGLDYLLMRHDGLLEFFHDYLRRAVEKRYLAGDEEKLRVHTTLADYFDRQVGLQIGSSRDSFYVYGRRRHEELGMPRTTQSPANVLPLYREQHRHGGVERGENNEHSVPPPIAREGAKQSRYALPPRLAEELTYQTLRAGLYQTVIDYRVPEPASTPVDDAPAAPLPEVAPATESVIASAAIAGVPTVETAVPDADNDQLPTSEETDIPVPEILSVPDIPSVPAPPVIDRDEGLAQVAERLRAASERYREELGLAHSRDRQQVADAAGGEGTLARISPQNSYPAALERFVRHLAGITPEEEVPETASGSAGEEVPPEPSPEQPDVVESRPDGEVVGQYELPYEAEVHRGGEPEIIEHVGGQRRPQPRTPARLQERPKITLEDYRRALQCFAEELELSQEEEDRHGMAEAYGDMGAVQLMQGDMESAGLSFARELEIVTELGDGQAIAAASGNLGLVHYNHGDYPRAMEYFSRELDIAREIGDRAGESVALGNIGTIYADQTDYSEALECYGAQFAIDEELGDRMGMSVATGNMGTVYQKRGDYRQALRAYQSALDDAIAIGFGLGEAHWLQRKAQLLVDLSRAGDPPAFVVAYVQENQREAVLHQARELARESIRIAGDLSRDDMAFEGELLVAATYSALGAWANAVERLKALLGSNSDDERRAMLHYELWKTTTFGSLPGDHKGREHAAEAARLYQALYARTPRLEYSKRIVELRSMVGRRYEV